MNEAHKKGITQIERLMRLEGITLPELIASITGTQTSTLYFSADQQVKFNQIYEKLECGKCSPREKGRLLEQLTDILFDEGLFHVLKNCRTSTNELDLLVGWTQNARLASMHTTFSFLGDTFICECKNYTTPVSVTYVGKFASLLITSRTKLGIMIAWNGISARSDWSDAAGLIKKIALKENIFIIVLDKADLKQLNDKRINIFSLLENKYNSLKNDIDYTEYITAHEAESSLTQ